MRTILSSSATVAIQGCACEAETGALPGLRVPGASTRIPMAS